MRLIDRLNIYREYNGLSVAVFEKACGLGNGYLGKQLKGKGSVGSDILEKISIAFPDLSLEWLITGRGKMINPFATNQHEQYGQEINEDGAVYVIRNKLITVLKEQLQLLESSVPAARKKYKKTRKSK